jgi:hypothetical protein
MKEWVKRIWIGWTSFAQLINRGIVYLLLGMVFFLLITPQAVFRRLVNKKKKDEGLVCRKHRYSFENLKKMW